MQQNLLCSDMVIWRLVVSAVQLAILSPLACRTVVPGVLMDSSALTQGATACWTMVHASQHTLWLISLCCLAGATNSKANNISSELQAKPYQTTGTSLGRPDTDLGGIFVYHHWKSVKEKPKGNLLSNQILLIDVLAGLSEFWLNVAFGQKCLEKVSL